MAREKSNSITELVKLVAAEVCDKKLEGLRERVSTLEKVHLTKEWVGKFTPDRVGHPWIPTEDKDLFSECHEFIDATAKKHGRTFQAIIARIIRKDILSQCKKYV